MEGIMNGKIPKNCCNHLSCREKHLFLQKTHILNCKKLMDQFLKIPTPQVLISVPNIYSNLL